MLFVKQIFQLIAKLLKTQNIYLTKSLSYVNTPAKLPINLDFIRHATLELCARNISNHNVEGNTAELGVYKGNFAQKLNLLFPDRKLYLFDTFEGFDDKDVKVDQKGDYSAGTQDFSDTSVERVMAKMSSPNQCIVKKGFFPATATDVDDRFCFVSLDADLYEPIYQGLVFFYPKLNKGGYIFIHDVNNEEYQGAKAALEKFCSENKINYVPIPDGAGTAILTK